MTCGFAAGECRFNCENSISTLCWLLRGTKYEVDPTQKDLHLAHDGYAIAPAIRPAIMRTANTHWRPSHSSPHIPRPGRG
jgi:hypothetical protein